MRGKGKGEIPEVQDFTAQCSCGSELRWEEVIPQCSLTTLSLARGSANKISHIPNAHKQFPNHLCKSVISLAAACTLPASCATVRLAEPCWRVIRNGYGPERDLQQPSAPELSKAPGKPSLRPRGPYPGLNGHLGVLLHMTP